MARITPSKPVGPIDIAQVLADAKAAREAGKKKARTRTVTVYLNPTAAEEANARVEEIHRLTQLLESREGRVDLSITEPDETRERLEQLNAEYDEYAEAFDSSELAVTFRDAKLGDYDAINAAMKADGHDASENETLMVYSIAQYATSPKFTPAQVVDLLEEIGSAQMAKLAAGYQSLLGGAPLLRRR